jgi:hypothetical protein
MDFIIRIVCSALEMELNALLVQVASLAEEAHVPFTIPPRITATNRQKKKGVFRKPQTWVDYQEETVPGYRILLEYSGSSQNLVDFDSQGNVIWILRKYEENEYGRGSWHSSLGGLQYLRPQHFDHTDLPPRDPMEVELSDVRSVGDQALTRVEDWAKLCNVPL